MKPCWPICSSAVQPQPLCPPSAQGQRHHVRIPFPSLIPAGHVQSVTLPALRSQSLSLPPPKLAVFLCGASCPHPSHVTYRHTAQKHQPYPCSGLLTEDLQRAAHAGAHLRWEDCESEANLSLYKANLNAQQDSVSKN